MVMATKWEYTAFEDEPRSHSLSLRMYGLEGWELVGVAPSPGGKVWHFLKRPSSE